jgi:site-specific recombinase XerD
VSLSVDQRTAILSVARSFHATERDIHHLAPLLVAKDVPSVGELLADALRACPTPSRSLYAYYLRELAARSGTLQLSDIDGFLLEQWGLDVRTAAAASSRGTHGYAAQEHFINAARFFFSWCVRAGYLNASPAAELRVPARRPNRRRALTEAELAAVLGAATATSADPELDELLLAFVRETAARREGVLNARVTEVNDLVASIILDEKGDKMREMPITRELAAAMRAHAGARHSGCERVFHYRSGACLTRRRIESMFARVQRELPWARAMGVSLHWLRHTTLTDVDRLAGSRVAAAYAGHSDAATGVIGAYTKVSFEELQAVHHQLFGS